MVKPRQAAAGDSVAPFLIKCYEMVDDEVNKGIVSWTDSPRSNSFVIHDDTQFTLHLLPKYWKHNNFSSFMRQLNIYGFKKMDADRWEFANDGFVKGQKHLLSTIARRKNIRAATDQEKSLKVKIVKENDNRADECAENNELWKEVRDLQVDKNALMQELVKLRQYQETADNNLVLLRERLKGMEKNQQQMISFLVMAMQNPGYFVKLLQTRENNWVGKNASVVEVSESEADDVTDDEMMATDGTIVRYQQPVYQEDAYPHPPLLPSNSLPCPPETEFSEDMQEFFMNSDLIRTLLDENEPMLDDKSPIVLPELHDDSPLDYFNFDSPPVGNSGYSNLESPLNGVVILQQMEPTHVAQIEQMDTTSSFGGQREDENHMHWGVALETDKYQDLVRLTAQMDNLVSNSKTIEEEKIHRRNKYT